MRLRFVDEIKTSSAEYRSSGRSDCSTTETPASGAISMRMPRVTPSRHPEFRGGVKTFSPLTTKIFAEVHSATPPRSFSMTTSSNPSLAPSATAHTLLSQEMLFTPDMRSEEHTSELQSPFLISY